MSEASASLANFSLSVASDFEASETIPIQLALRHVHLIDAGAALAPGELARMARALAAADAPTAPTGSGNGSAAGRGGSKDSSTQAGLKPAVSESPSSNMPRVGAVTRAAIDTMGGAAAVVGGPLRAAADAALRAMPWLPSVSFTALPADAAELGGVQVDDDPGFISGRGVTFHWASDAPSSALAPHRRRLLIRERVMTAVKLPPQVQRPVSHVAHAVRNALQPPLQAAAGVIASATAPLRRTLAARLPPPADVALWPPVVAWARGIATARMRLRPGGGHLDGRRPHALVLVSDAHAPSKAMHHLARSRGVPVVMAYIQHMSALSDGGSSVNRDSPVAGIATALATATPQPSAAMVLLHSIASPEPTAPASFDVADGPQPVSEQLQAPPTGRQWANIGSAITDRLPPFVGRRVRGQNAAESTSIAIETIPDGWIDGSGLQPGGVAALRHAVHSALMHHASDSIALKALADAGDPLGDDLRTRNADDMAGLPKRPHPALAAVHGVARRISAEVGPSPARSRL